MNKYIISISCVAIVITILISFGAFAQQPAKEGVINVGILYPLTGPGASWGVGNSQGWRHAFDLINEAGGVKVGDTQYKFKYFVEDDKYSGSVAVTACNKLIFQDKVKFLLGPLGGMPAAAIAPICQANKVLNLEVGKATDIINPNNSHIFKILNCRFEDAPVYWKWIKENLSVKKVLVVGCDDETGWGETAASVKAAQYVGLEIVGKEFFPRPQTDFYPLLTRWLKLNPDLIEFSGCTTENLKGCIPQARELGYKGRFSGMLGYSGDFLIKAVGAQVMEGFTYIVAQYHVYWGDISRERKAFLDGAIKKFGGDKPDVGLYLDFSHVPFMLAQAIEKAGTLDTDKVAATLRSHTWDTTKFGFGVNVPYGSPMPYGINNALPNPTVILQVRNGKVTTVSQFASEEIGKLSIEYWSKLGKP